MRFIYTSILLFLVFNLSAQPGIAVSGRVLDENQQPLASATVQMVGQRIFSTTTSEDGDFRFYPLPSGFYEMYVSYVGYETYKKEYFEVVNRKSLGNIVLSPSKTDIKEVVVNGKTPLAVVRGDTMEYNADNYKTNPDADAEDLIKKMPGIVVEDGAVQAQGEDVKKVYVDGKSFFGQDPTLALKTLPAEVIQKIEIFDEQSEQSQFTGFDDGETNKVMNVITRLKMRNGQFGKVYGGIGLDGKYTVGGNISMFDGDRRISIIGQSNNVNQQNFSSEDLLGVLSSGSSRRGGFRGGGGPPPGGGKGGQGGPGGGARGMSGGGASSQDFMVGNQSGITNTPSLGLNYTDKWGEKIQFSGSYFFNASENYKTEDVFQDYLTDIDTFSQTYTEDAISESQNYNHRLNFKMDYEINENNNLIIQPRLSFQSNESESSNTGQSFINDSLLNTYVNTYDADRNGYNFSNRVTLMHKFATEGRTISLSSNQSINTNNSEATQFTETVNAATAMRSDSLNQFNDNSTQKQTVSVRAAYTEPLGDYAQLMINASAARSMSDYNKEVFNYDYTLGSYHLPDTFLSNDYESSYNTHQLGASYMYRWGKRNNLMIGANYQHATLTSDQVFPATTNIERTYNSVLPTVRLRLGSGMKNGFNMMYRTSTSSPSVSQLQSTIDNSNVLQMSSGNPYLDPSYSHNLSFRYNTSNTQNGTVFFIMANLEYTDNYIGNDTWYAVQDTILGDDVVLQQGGQFSRPVNLDHSWSARSFLTYGIPASFMRSNFNINLGYSYNYTPGIYNGEDIYSDNHVLTGGLTLASNISENVDFTISSKTNYNSTNSSYLTTNNNYITQKTEAQLSLIFPHGIVVRGALASQYYYWTATEEDESFVMMNLELGKKFGKKQLAELKLSVFDALNQNQSFSRNVTDIYIEDVQTNVLQRYAMLTFSYKLRHFKM